MHVLCMASDACILALYWLRHAGLMKGPVLQECVVVLDERGRDTTSHDMANLIAQVLTDTRPLVSVWLYSVLHRQFGTG